MFDFSIVTQWIDSLLRSCMSDTAALIVECVLIGVCLLLGYAVIALILIFAERKICAYFQCRLGPNRVGPWGSTVDCRYVQNAHQRDYPYRPYRQIPL